jgi:hypothetical protein
LSHRLGFDLDPGRQRYLEVLDLGGDMPQVHRAAGGGFFDHFGASTYSWGRQLGGLDAVGSGMSQHPAVGCLLAGVWLCGAAMMFVRLLVRIAS